MYNSDDETKYINNIKYWSNNSLIMKLNSFYKNTDIVKKEVVIFFHLLVKVIKSITNKEITFD